MMQQANLDNSQPPQPAEIRPATPPIGSRFLIILVLGFVLLALAAAHPLPIKATWEQFASILQPKSSSPSASSAALSESQRKELAAKSPQQQAAILMQRAISHSDGAIELIDNSLPRWYGHINSEKAPLAGLLYTAINTDDLRVRAASLDIYLVAYDQPKTTETVDQLLLRLENEPEHRAWILWVLGALGNRGVETTRIESVLEDRIHAPDLVTRTWAVEGLGLLATDNSIAPLLGVLRGDPSPQVRERAACSLAQSGMFTPQQRLLVVPGLLDILDDISLDPATRGWVAHALSDITGASLGTDSSAWRQWWEQHSPR
ncbi:MAG: hypothetical protein PVS2B2_11300 [Candidatus Acidiferrum sp.]